MRMCVCTRCMSWSNGLFQPSKGLTLVPMKVCASCCHVSAQYCAGSCRPDMKKNLEQTQNHWFYLHLSTVHVRRLHTYALNIRRSACWARIIHSVDPWSPEAWKDNLNVWRALSSVKNELRHITASLLMHAYMRAYTTAYVSICIRSKIRYGSRGWKWGY
jgi:hypothetical protein